MTPSEERPSETAQVELALRALKELVRAAHQRSLYGTEHPITRQACDAAAEALVGMMSGRADFTLTVTESELLAEGEELPQSPPLQQLHENLRRRQVAALVIRPGLTWEEVSALIGVLATEPIALANAGGACRALLEARCEHLELRDVDYGRFVPESQARWLSSFSGHAGATQTSVQDLVSVCVDLPGDRLRIAAGETTERGMPMPFPIPVAQGGDAAAERDGPAFGDHIAALSDVSVEDFMAVGLAWLIQASGEAVLEGPAQVRKAWRENVAQRIAKLELSLQARIYRAPRQPGSSAPDMLAALVADRSPEEIADLILARPAAVVGEPSSLLERILRRTLRDERTLLAVEPLLRDRLMARGMSQDSFRNVVGLLLDQIATDMAMRVEGTAAYLGDFAELPVSGLGTVDQWPDLLATVADDAVAKARACILLNMLPHEHDAARYLELVGLIEAATDERAAVKDPAVPEMVRALVREVRGGDAMRAPIARAGLQRLGTPEVARAMREALAGAPREEQPELIAVIGLMGNQCVEILLEQTETETDPELRAVAVRWLADAGERGAAEVRHVLAQGPFDRAIFAARALIEAGDQRFLHLLAAGLEHRQTAVRMRLAEWLGSAPGLVCEQLLIRALYDEDPGVQAQAAQSLGGMRATGAVHALSVAAKKGPLHGRMFEVRKAAVQALGRIGAAEAVPALRELARRRSLWFREHSEELSALAAGALALIPGPEAREALAECAPQVRERALGAAEPPAQKENEDE